MNDTAQKGLEAARKLTESAARLREVTLFGLVRVKHNRERMHDQRRRHGALYGINLDAPVSDEPVSRLREAGL